MKIGRPLSPLEATALGIVLKQGPCVAHAVVSQFADSQTYAYRSGAGSIYPLLKRMAEAGLVAYAARKYTITKAGIDALRSWILPPFGDNQIGTNLDVLRSRVYFLKLLDEGELSEFLRASIAELNKLLDDCRDTVLAQRQSGDRFGELATLGAVYETEARLAWMNKLRAELSDTG